LWIAASSEGGASELLAGSWVWNSLPAGTDPFIPVTNTGQVDTAPPVLSAAAFSQASVDVTTEGVLVPLTLDITDNLSGFSSASVSLEQAVSAGQNAILASTVATPAHRISGTALNGRYQVQFFLPQNSPAGVWSLYCELSDILGNSFRVASAATLTVDKIPYTAWVIAHGLTGPGALPDADPDLDGQRNVEEFAFHTDPKRGTFRVISLSVPDRVYLFQGALPLPYLTGGELHLRFLRRRGANAGNVTTVAQFGADASGWSPATNVTVSPFSAEWEMVDARDPIPPGPGRRRFGRVLVTMP
jgi:hypothetical protein